MPDIEALAQRVERKRIPWTCTKCWGSPALEPTGDDDGEYECPICETHYFQSGSAAWCRLVVRVASPSANAVGKEGR